MTTNEILELLCRRFPNCFAMLESRRRPLKLGIHDDILAALGDQVDPTQLGQALRIYVSNLRYRMMQKEGAPRIDLNGDECGAVSEADAAGAAADVARRKAKAIARRQEALRLPKPVPVIEPPPPPEPPKRASLADLRAAAARRKAAG